MSFRQKINGPMCFVEFEEVGAASQAIKDLYGHTLVGPGRSHDAPFPLLFESDLFYTWPSETPDSRGHG